MRATWFKGFVRTRYFRDVFKFCLSVRTWQKFRKTFEIFRNISKYYEIIGKKQTSFSAAARQGGSLSACGHIMRHCIIELICLIMTYCYTVGMLSWISYRIHVLEFDVLMKVDLVSISIQL